jgi:hypothetical protein
MLGFLITLALIPVVTITVLVLVARSTRPTSRYRAPHYVPGLRVEHFESNPDALPVRPKARAAR